MVRHVLAPAERASCSRTPNLGHHECRFRDESVNGSGLRGDVGAIGHHMFVHTLPDHAGPDRAGVASAWIRERGFAHCGTDARNCARGFAHSDALNSAIPTDLWCETSRSIRDEAAIVNGVGETSPWMHGSAAAHGATGCARATAEARRVECAAPVRPDMAWARHTVGRDRSWACRQSVTEL
jgi:hypothetical protein